MKKRKSWLGVSYFTALWRCKYDWPRLEQDLSFLAGRGFNYYRMLSMLGYYPAWDDLEIPPVSFTNRVGKHVDVWPDYWEQLGRLIDVAFDGYGLRTQITIVTCSVVCPDPIRLMADRQRLSCHRFKAFSATQSRHGF